MDTREVADDIRRTLFGEDGPPQAGSGKNIYAS